MSPKRLDRMHRDVRAEWLDLARPNRLPNLETLQLDPSWLDKTIEHKGARWRVAGIDPRDYGYGRPARVTLADDSGATITMGREALRKIMSHPS